MFDAETLAFRYYAYILKISFEKAFDYSLLFMQYNWIIFRRAWLTQNEIFAPRALAYLFFTGLYIFAFFFKT